MAIRRKIDNIKVEGAQIIYRNFTGEVGVYNKNGDKSFSWRIEDPELAEKLKSDGWNVKLKEPKDPDGEPFWHLPVCVKFGNYPPKVIMITEMGRQTKLDEDTISMLDGVRILNADIVIRPYCWETQNDSGVKAYLQVGYFTISDGDPFASKYEEMDYNGDAF